ncbi:MAG: thioesterase [Deltaproteobacteria bacterium]|nr:thioesterase [Deltaproteobacteria bacterium]
MLTVGLTREATVRTTPADSATLVSPLVPDVYASARMIAFAEATCAALMAEHVGPGETSVGVGFQFTHEAATPIGMTVRVRVRLAELDRRRCVFEVEAHDAADRIAIGRHERFVVDREKFMARVRAKASASGAGTGG